MAFYVREIFCFYSQNYNSENETFLQYVGTPRGVYRTYPAHAYSENRCYPSDTTYDCRSRPWFLSAATGPKDIIVLMDGSDSMNVNGRLDITKDAISKFINALSDGDYFNLLWVKEKGNLCLFLNLYNCFFSIIVFVVYI